MGLLKGGGPLEVQVPVPAYFTCPISLELMRDPVTLSSGQTFDRSNIQKWLDDGHGTCPVTRMPIDCEQEEPIPNHALRRMIQTWCVQNKSAGIERILTPRQPPSLKDIPLLLDQIRLRHSSTDHTHRHADAIQKLCVLVSDRPKARLLLLHAGAAPLLTLLLSKSLPLCRKSTPASVEVEDTLRLLASLAEESARFSWKPARTEEVFALAEMMADVRARHDVRQNAAIVLSRAAAELSEFVKKEVGAKGGFMHSVVGLVREAPAASMASLQGGNSSSSDNFCNAGLDLLLAICSTSSTKNRELAKEAGALGALANLMGELCPTDSSCPDKMNTKTIELGLKVWECLCKCADVRASTWRFVGLLASLMCSVSPKATKYSVRIIWLLIKCSPPSAEMARHAVEQGTFLKAMAVAQGNASPKTRSLANKIVKALSAFVFTPQSPINLQ